MAGERAHLAVRAGQPHEPRADAPAQAAAASEADREPHRQGATEELHAYPAARLFRAQSSEGRDRAGARQAAVRQAAGDCGARRQARDRARDAPLAVEVVRPDRARFWRPWRRRFPRLVLIIPAAFMVTLLLIAIDWTPLGTYPLEWLPYIAWFLLLVLWPAIAFTFLAIAFLAVALQVERIELDAGRIRRHLVFGRRMEVPVEGASLIRRKGLDVVRAASTKRRLLAPHVFYALEDLDRLWATPGLAPADPEAPAG